MSRPYSPPAPWGYQLSVMVALGQHDEAGKLLAACNRFNVAFGGTPFAMPAPAGSINGLVTCPALPAPALRVAA